MPTGYEGVNHSGGLEEEGIIQEAEEEEAVDMINPDGEVRKQDRVNDQSRWSSEKPR